MFRLFADRERYTIYRLPPTSRCSEAYFPLVHSLLDTSGDEAAVVRRVVMIKVHAIGASLPRGAR